jgi:glycosyltransferase involved in cell wall biosynthesis
MPDSIVGMMFNYNEGDILEETLEAFLPHVDSLFISDDNSTDNSWGIIRSFKDKIEYMRNKRDNPLDQGQRQSILNEIRKRYKPEDTWVQILDADMMILETDIRESLKKYAIDDLTMSWVLLNGCRTLGAWKEVDFYPNWITPITNVMSRAHMLEDLVYTFRPLPKLEYNLDKWRPWPQNFSFYSDKILDVKNRELDAPLIAHYGYRGPTHFYLKYGARKQMFSKKYPSWNLDSIESIESTVYFFNGEWNRELFPMTRDGWIEFRKREE